MVGGAGCAAASDEPDDDVAVDEATLSSSLIQVLGTIAPGDAVSVPYTATPKYRAYSVTAAAGSKVTFKVTSESGGDAFAFILGSARRKSQRCPRAKQGEAVELTMRPLCDFADTGHWKRRPGWQAAPASTSKTF